MGLWINNEFETFMWFARPKWFPCEANHLEAFSSSATKRLAQKPWPRASASRLLNGCPISNVGVYTTVEEINVMMLPHPTVTTHPASVWLT